MTNAPPLVGVEERLLAQLRREPAIICDLAAALHVPVFGVEAVLHSLRRRGLVEVHPAGCPPIQTWQVVA